MIVEEKLKNLILTKYKSLREFSLDNDIPYTTFKSMLERGINNSSVTNVIKLCKALNISADALADGEIVFKSFKKEKRPDNRVEIKDVLDDTKRTLENGDVVTLDGKPINQEVLTSIIDAMDLGVELAKRKK